MKAIRFAADRIGDAGVVCYVNNDSFVAEKSFDGMRKHLAQDFDLIYVLELGGNVRKNPKLSGTTHNVFGIQVGVSINLFIRLPKKAGAKRRAKIHYHAVPVDWRREQKYDFLNKAGSIAGVKWRRLKPGRKAQLAHEQERRRVRRIVPTGSKKYKARSNLGLPDGLPRPIRSACPPTATRWCTASTPSAWRSASSSSSTTTMPNWIGGARRPSRRKTGRSWSNTSTHFVKLRAGRSGAETLKTPSCRGDRGSFRSGADSREHCTGRSP